MGEAGQLMLPMLAALDRPAALVPSQEDTPKGESTEQETGTPEAEDDSRRHGFLILSREDSTMVRGRAL